MVGNNPRSSTVDRVLLEEGPMADTVVNHYATTNTDGSKSHGAVIHTVANGLVQQSFWYSDQSQHILATQRFYQAVDTLAVDDLDALLSPGYVAVFGAGVHARRPKHTNRTCMMGGDCTGGATVGGAKHNDGDGKLMQLDEFKSFLLGFPARCPEEGR